MVSSSLSNDKRNFQCVAVASVDLIKLPLRDILTCNIKPADLFQKIKSCSTLNLRKEQKTICQIPPPARPDYNLFDVTLLYTLIRNLCSLPSPAQGWGHEPTGSDTQLSDDIERLRLFRNSYYAHANSAEISDSSFKDIWRNLRSAISRIQSRYNVDYEDELIRIEQSKYTLSHWEECMTLLKTVAIKQNPSDSGDEPYIIIKGKNEIICGGTARFEADVKNVESSCWSITWQKRRGDDIKCIDTNLGRYNSSAKKTLVIKSVCKEDEGDYQAFLSLDSNGPDYKSRNKIRLYAIGEVPFLNISGVITRREGIAIHYNCGVPDQSPKVHHIEWSKNGQPLDINNKKYVGGGVHDSFLTITSPTYEDRGNYFCKVTNAVGTVQRNEMLDVPKVKISEDSTVCFGSKTNIKSDISSTPTPDKIEWQNSEDGINFHCIGIANSTEKKPLSLCPLLKIDRAAFDDKLYYRLLVWNGIGEAVSNTVDLKVPGSPPNLTTSFVTDIENRSVKLIGNVYVYDDSPGILQTFWTKNDKSINTRESKGKLSETRTDNLSLTITNVGPDDAGEYKLTAINAVGSTTSDAIVLGVPCVFLDRVDDEKNVRRITLTIKSLPAPNKIQWNAKNKDDDTFTPININSKEYKGTTVSFPHPLLVVRQSDQLEKTSYKIEVINFIGKTVQSIPGNIKSAVSKKDIVQNTFYKDRGARVRFTKLSNVLAKDFPTQKIEKLKYTLKNLNIVQNLKSVMEATSALECIRILQDEELFTHTDVIVMQFLCSQTECLDLYAKCFEYAEQQKALCYFEKPPVNGYKNVQFHIKGELSGHDKDYIQNVIETVAAILDCKGEDILLNGVQHSNSFLLSLSVKTVYIRKLLAMNEQDRLRLIRLNIDYILIDKETINLERPRGYGSSVVRKRTGDDNAVEIKSLGEGNSVVIKSSGDASPVELKNTSTGKNRPVIVEISGDDNQVVIESTGDDNQVVIESPDSVCDNPEFNLQDLVRCHLCETPDLSLFCEKCEIYLCKKCVGMHLLEKSKKHKLVSFDLRKRTKWIRKCLKHSTKYCKFYCNECDILICKHCRYAIEHKNHSFVDAMETFETKIHIIQSDLEELESSVCPKYEEIVSNTLCQKAVLKDNSFQVITEIDKYGDEMHREVDNIVTKLKSDLHDIESRNLDFLNRLEYKITLTISEITHSIEELKDLLNSYDIGLISAYKSRNAEFRRMPSKPTISLPRFSPQEMNKEQIRQQFGSLSVESFDTKDDNFTIDCPNAATSPKFRSLIDEPRIVTEFKTKFDNLLCSVSCRSDELIWTCGHKESTMRLYSLQGKPKNVINTISGKQPGDIAVTRSWDLVYTDRNDRTVNIVKNTNIETLITLQEWEPCNVCSTYLGDLLVVMISNDHKQAKVVRYSGSKEKQIIQYDSKGQPLYSYGYFNKYISENKNFDVCVADRDAGAIVVVNEIGDLQFTFNGPPSQRKPFRPIGIITDSQCRILISDPDNNCVHILNQDGKLLGYIDNCALQRPHGLCVDTEDNLFVAELSTCKIKKIKYCV